MESVVDFPVTPVAEANKNLTDYVTAPLSSAQIVQFSARKIVRVLTGIFLFLFGLHLLTVVAYQFHIAPNYTLYGKFYFDQERNFPSYFSSLLLLLVAVLLRLIATTKHRQYDPFSQHWKWLAAIFVFLGLDEAISLHELLIDPLREAWHTSGYLRFPWVVVGGILVLSIGLYYLRFLRSLPASTQWRFALAGFLYVLGTIGMEMVSGSFFIETDLHNLPYEFTMTIEETLEMTSMIFFVATLLKYIQRREYDTTIEIR